MKRVETIAYIRQLNKIISKATAKTLYNELLYTFVAFYAAGL